jgi:hypothetical protein
MTAGFWRCQTSAYALCKASSVSPVSQADKEGFLRPLREVFLPGSVTSSSRFPYERTASKNMASCLLRVVSISRGPCIVQGRFRGCPESILTIRPSPEYKSAHFFHKQAGFGNFQNSFLPSAIKRAASRTPCWAFSDLGLVTRSLKRAFGNP